MLGASIYASGECEMGLLRQKAAGGQLSRKRYIYPLFNIFRAKLNLKPAHD
jgi:hypothetical protein